MSDELYTSLVVGLTLGIPLGLLTATWMRWLYNQKVGRPARVNAAFYVFQLLSMKLTDIEERRPGLTQNRAWAWARGVLGRMQQRNNLEWFARVWFLPRVVWSRAGRHFSSRHTVSEKPEYLDLFSDEEVFDVIRSVRDEWPNCGEELKRVYDALLPLNRGAQLAHRLLMWKLRMEFSKSVQSIDITKWRESVNSILQDQFARQLFRRMAPSTHQ